MKRLLVLLALLGALAAPGRLAAQQIHVGLGGQLSSIVHVPIVIPVVADLTGRPEKLGSYSLRLQWNPAVLQITGGGDGTFGGATVNGDSLTAGVLRMAGVNSAGASGIITLVNLELLPLIKAVDTLKLTLTELYAAGTFADLYSLAVVTNGVYCPARGLWGDIDGDGNANSRDALIALSNAVGLDVSAFDISLGDVDGNGLTNARDALIILSNAVGVDVSAYRVMRLAGGACSAFTGVALSVTPGPVELVRGQTVKFEAWAADSVTGALQAVANPTWKSNASMVLVVGPDGQASARDTGTAVVTALRGLRDSAQTTVHVIARRTTSWVDAVAVNATNRLGTTDLPFGSIDEGLQFAQDGDTLRIRVGRYEIQSGSLGLSRPIVLLGDTAADGSRPTLVPDSNAAGWYGDGIDIMTSGRVEVQNLAFSGVTTGVYVGGADCVLLRGVRMHTYTDGVYVDSPTHCLRIEHSQLLGPEVPYLDAPVAGSPVQRGPVQRVAGSAAYYYGGAGVTTYGPVDTLTIEDTEVAGFYIGVNVETIPDTTTIRHSQLHDFEYGAVVTGGCYDCTAPYGTPPARPAARARPAHAPVARSALGGMSSPAAIVIELSRIERSQNSALIDLEAYFRRVAFAYNVLSNPGRDVLYLYADGAPGNGGYVSMVGDSILAPPENQHQAWLNASHFDSLVIDSLRAVGFGYGSTYDVPLVRLTNSTLRDVRGGNCECDAYGLEVSFSSTPGGVLQLDNDTVIGDPRDDARMDAFEHNGARVEANRITVINAAEGIDAEYSDSSTTITNSVFRHVQNPIYWELNTYPGPSASTLTVTHSTFDGFSWGVQAYDGRMVVDSNTFVNGQQPIYLDTPRPIAVRGNSLSASPNGIQLYTYDSTTTVTVAGNVLSGIASQGIYVQGSSYPPDALQTVFDVRGNTVTCDAAGAAGVAGIELYDAHMAVNDNQVSNCYEGIRTVVAANTPRSDSIVGNIVTAPASAHFGIGVSGSIVARIGRNTVTGAATGGQTAGLIDADGPWAWWAYTDYGPSVVTIDSNTVTGGTNFGIRAMDSDSLVILGNTVQNLNSPTAGYNGYPQDVAGITVMGYLSSFARVVGNVVKHIAGSGVVLDHPYDGLVVQVDSNVVADVGPSAADTTVGGTGIYPYAGPATITRNLVTGARRDGILVTSYDAIDVTGNNISGNLPYGFRVQADRGSVPALDNWWGDPLGPRCASGCDLASAGDSVSGVDFSTFRTAPNDSAPTTVPLAPRFLAGARALPVVRAASGSGRQGTAFPRVDRFPAERPAARQAAASGVPSASEPGAQHRAAQQQARAELEAQRAQRIQEVRARIEARDAARRAAKAAQAARAAAHAASPGGTRSQGVRP